MTIVVCIFVCVLAITAYTLGIYQDKKKLRKQFLNKSKERRVPDDTLRFLFPE